MSFFEKDSTFRLLGSDNGTPYLLKNENISVVHEEALKCGAQMRVYRDVRAVIGYEDNFPPSKHRSARVEKKLRKRLGSKVLYGPRQVVSFSPAVEEFLFGNRSFRPLGKTE